MKTVIIDTSVLIDNPNILTNLPESDIVLPVIVLHELDKLKTQQGQVGKNARIAIKSIDKIIENNQFLEKVELENKSFLKIDTMYYENTSSFGPSKYPDTQILCTAYNYHFNKTNQEKVILLSNDICLRAKCKAFGIAAEEYKQEKKESSELYAGVFSTIDEMNGNNLIKNGVIEDQWNLFPNECIIFKNQINGIITLGRKCYNGKVKNINKQYPWGLTPRNNEQVLAIDLLMDEHIDLVSLIGKAGSGKSLCAISCCLELLFNKKKYDKLIIYRPIQEVGEGIGYLPGEKDQKIEPYFQSVMDSLEILLGQKNNNWKKDLELWKSKGKIEFGIISYIRGRSLPNSLILVDEAQNISKEEMKTIITRVGENSKIIINGDLDQIDRNDLNYTNNGLFATIEAFKEYQEGAHITFVKGERSKLATIAAEIF